MGFIACAERENRTLMGYPARITQTRILPITHSLIILYRSPPAKESCVLIFSTILLVYRYCRSDEIGNRTRLKIVRRKACGFESHLRHLSISKKPTLVDLCNTSYVVGLAIGDGNLSNPNGRAVRLRISCDTKYPNIIKNVQSALQRTMPSNKVSLIQRRSNCIDVSCYSNKWEKILGWTANGGPKFIQKVSVPSWIMDDKIFTTFCLRGLIETDGSIYKDRGYLTINFVTIIPRLANDVIAMITNLGFLPNLQIHKHAGRQTKYTIRISRSAKEFIKRIGADKS